MIIVREGIKEKDIVPRFLQPKYAEKTCLTVRHVFYLPNNFIQVGTIQIACGQFLFLYFLTDNQENLFYSQDA